MVRRNSVYDKEDRVPNGRGYMLEYGFGLGCGGRPSAGGGVSLSGAGSSSYLGLMQAAVI